jgi:hypothetical protein
LFVLLEGDSSDNSSDESGSGPPDVTLVEPSSGKQATRAVPPGFVVKRPFKLSMRKGLHLKLLFGLRDPQPELAARPLVEPGGQEPAAAGDEEQDGDTDMDACSSCSEGQVAAPTEHLSQLPDAAPQLPCGGRQQPVAEGRLTPGGSPAGSTWYLCRVTVKGLNRGSRDEGE